MDEVEARVKKEVEKLQAQVNVLSAELRRLQRLVTHPSTRMYINKLAVLKTEVGDLLGTANQVVVTNGLDCLAKNENVTLSTPQDIHDGASPTFAGLNLTSDTAKAIFGAGSDMSMWYDGTDGHIKTDDVAPSDLKVACGAERTIELTNVVYDDLRIFPGAFDRPGVADPTAVIYYPNGGGLGVYLYEFALNDFVCFAVQLPHSYKQGTDIAVHVHWTAGARGVAESGNKVGWKIDYSWANHHEAFPDMQTADLSHACTGTDHLHEKSGAVVIDGHTVPTKEISSMLICNLRRSDTGTDDTWSSVVPGEQPMILEVDFHYQLDTIGSRTILTK